MATSQKHYLSFTDHLGLYLPHFLRPALPRDLRPLPSPSRDNIATPEPTPERPQSHVEKRIRETVDPNTVTTTISNSHSRHENESDEEKRQQQQEKVREVLEGGKGKSKEGYHVSLILTNSGSVARDHLASERTFLAYVRTSLALASTGVALVQLFTIATNAGTVQQGTPQQLLLRRFATPLGSTIILLALVLLSLGCLRYFAIQTALTRGVFPAARLTVIFTVSALSIVTGIVFGVLVRGRS